MRNSGVWIIKKSYKDKDYLEKDCLTILGVITTIRRDNTGQLTDAVIKKNKKLAAIKNKSSCSLKMLKHRVSVCL